MRKRKGILAFILALLLFLTLTWSVGWLLMPVRTAYGSMWDAYLQEPEDSVDVLLLGSSMVYCDVVPACIWESSGVRSYILAGPEQTMPVTYYYLREACRTQSPQMVVLDLSGMFFHTYEHYTKANIGYMPLSANRLAATWYGAEREERMGLLFPLKNYHSRWQEVKASELEARTHPTADLLAGYTLLTEADPLKREYEREATAETGTYRDNLEWLAKIARFCEESGITLLPVIMPSVGKFPAAALDTLRQDVAALGLSLTDFNEILPELETDLKTDWYDGLHFNLRGAVKFSRRLGTYFANRSDLSPAEGADTALWEARLAYLEHAYNALPTETAAGNPPDSVTR